MLINPLSNFVHSRWYWAAVVAFGLSLESVALFYQHVLGEPPCVLCIQARVCVLTGILFGLVGLVGQNVSAVRLISQVGLLASLGFLVNRAWITVLVERGLYDGQCGMDAGFPAWLALDKWFPNVFEVWTMCGFTPDLMFGVSMGEGLLFCSLTLSLIATLALILMITRLQRSH